LSTGGGGYETIFIKCDLVKADEQQLEALDQSGEFTAEGVEVLVTDGYKYGLGATSDGGGFIATLTDKSPNSPFYNHCLSGRGRTAIDARNALLYKHLYKLQGDWANAQTGSVSQWG